MYCLLSSVCSICLAVESIITPWKSPWVVSRCLLEFCHIVSLVCVVNIISSLTCSIDINTDWIWESDVSLNSTWPSCCTAESTSNRSVMLLDLISIPNIPEKSYSSWSCPWHKILWQYFTHIPESPKSLYKSMEMSKIFYMYCNDESMTRCLCHLYTLITFCRHI